VGGIGANGYRLISVGQKKFLVHRLIAEAFFGEPPDEFVYKTVNHKNGDKLDNRPENLEWATYKENNLHARSSGLQKQHGENCNLTKHSDAFIDAIRKVHAKYHPTQAVLGELFGLSRGHISQIINFKTRAHK